MDEATQFPNPSDEKPDGQAGVDGSGTGVPLTVVGTQIHPPSPSVVKPLAHVTSDMTFGTQFPWPSGTYPLGHEGVSSVI